MVASKIFGRALARIHGTDGVCHLVALGSAGFFRRLLENPHVTVGAQAVLGEPRFAGALLELVNELTLTVIAPVGDRYQRSFERVRTRDLEQLRGTKMRSVADDRQFARTNTHLGKFLHQQRIVGNAGRDHPHEIRPCRADLGDKRRRVGERRRVGLVNHHLEPGLFEASRTHGLHEAHGSRRIVLNNAGRGRLLSGHALGKLHDGGQGKLGLAVTGRRSLKDVMETASCDHIGIG